MQSATPNQLKQSPAAQAGTRLPARPCSGRYMTFIGVQMHKLTALLAFLALGLANVSYAEDVMGFSREQIHEMVQQHEQNPLSDEAQQNRGILLAHFEPVDYIVCGFILGPLSESENPAHEAIMMQIIFASGDWVEENPENASDIDAYTLAGLESGLRAYEIALKEEPSSQHPVLDNLAQTGASEFNQEYPCRAQ